MSLVIPVGFANVHFRFGLVGDPEEMICGIGVDHAGSGGGTFELADVCFDAWAAGFTAGDTQVGWAFMGTTVYIGQAGTDPIVAHSTRAPITGTATGATLPVNVSMLVKKQTALGGRRGRGRMYLPPCYFAEGSVNNTGLIDAAARDFIQTSMNVVANNAVVDWVLLHNDVPAPAPAPTPITSFVVDQLVATQRRRLR